MVNRLLYIIIASVLFIAAADARADVYYVATDGSDLTGDGSLAEPWQTPAHALNVGIPAIGDATVVVRPGLYDGPTIITRPFANEVVIRSEVDHHAVLTNLAGAGTILAVYLQGDANLAIEGFVITGEGATGPICSVRRTNMIHFENASSIRFQNNIVYGNNREPFCNDLMKINRSTSPIYPRNIRILGNVFYNHPQVFGNDLIDSVRPGEIEISDNIFFSDTGVSAGQAHVTLKREVTGADVPPDAQSPRYTVSRNIFLNWEGDAGQPMLNFGEDGVSTHELTEAVVENNLFLGNSANPMSAPIQFKGVKGITVRANTIVGDFPSATFGLRLGTTGLNPTVEDVYIYNNLFSDPTGTMGPDFLVTFGSVNLGTVDLNHNLYWNDGNALPVGGDLLPADDVNGVTGDPLLGADQADIVLPKWDTAQQRFGSGSITIREEFERLVHTYGAIETGSAAIGAADPTNSPDDDILGQARDASPDLGAYEASSATAAPALQSRISMTQNVPNPFSGASVVWLELPKPGDISVRLYDARGRLAKTLLERRMPGGRHPVMLDAGELPGGVYFYKLTAGDRTIVRRCVVLR
jgi:hypothetical protein